MLEEREMYIYYTIIFTCLSTVAIANLNQDHYLLYFGVHWSLAIKRTMSSSHYTFFELPVRGIVWMTGEHFNEVKWQNSTSPMWCADSGELMLSAVCGSKD